MKKTLFVLAVVLSAVSLTARDFDATTPSGHTLYCDMVQGGAMIVGWDYSSDGTEPIHLTIPSVVSNGGASLYVVAIGDNAFSYCNRLLSVDIPSTVRVIGQSAFKGCYGMGSFPVPSTVDSIGQDAFANIPNVEYTGASQGAPWGALALNAYHEGPYYYSDSQKTHLVCCERDAVDAVVPPTVTSIGDYAYAFCANVSSISIDSTVEHVGLSAFMFCHGLENVFFNPCQSDEYVFAECHGLRHLTFGSMMTTIPLGLCRDCTNLQTVIFPDNLQTINGGGAFMGCVNLREIIFPVGINIIGTDAFSGCSGVERIVCMKETVPSHTGMDAFYGIDPGIEVIVPCGRESLYGQSYQWQRFDSIVAKSYYVLAGSNDESMGRAVVLQQPDCDDNTAIVEAIPETGCRFVRWDDNNTDNPMQINHSGGGYVRRTAIFQRETGIAAADVTAVSLYPNPTRDRLTVERPSAGPATFEVFNAKGQKVLSQTSDQAVVTLDVSSLAAGSYLLRVTTAEGSSVRSFVVGR